MPEPRSFDYAVIRVVPRVEREEFINVGVILFCRTARFLDARIEMDTRRISSFAPHVNLEELRANLDHVVQIARGDGDAGPIATLSPAERWHWLTAPRSTIMQLSPGHSGLGDDPGQVLTHLMKTMVSNFREDNEGAKAMDSLAERHAHPDGTAERLTDEDMAALLSQIPDWEVVDGRLRRDSRVKDFRAALAFVHRVGDLAEEQNHHPDILIHGWNRVRLELYTHTAAGITENDFIMAAKFDRLLST